MKRPDSGRIQHYPCVESRRGCLRRHFRGLGKFRFLVPTRHFRKGGRTDHGPVNGPLAASAFRRHATLPRRRTAAGFR